MSSQPTVDGVTPEATLVTSAVVPHPVRRATARQREDQVKRRISEHIEEHQQRTISDIAKGLNANRDTIAAWISRVTSGEITRGLGGQSAIAHSLSDQVTPDGTSDQEVEPTVTAVLDDGPLRGTSIEAQVVQGRPPPTVDVPGGERGTYRYCLAEWTQAGPSAVYTFLSAFRRSRVMSSVNPRLTGDAHVEVLLDLRHRTEPVQAYGSEHHQSLSGATIRRWPSPIPNNSGC